MKKLVSVGTVLCAFGWLAFAGVGSSLGQKNVVQAPAVHLFAGEALHVEMVIGVKGAAKPKGWFLRDARIVVLGGRSFLVGGQVAADGASQSWAAQIYLPLADVRLMEEYSSIENMMKDHPTPVAKKVMAKKTQLLKGWGDIIDPDRDCRIKESDGTVTMTVPGKHHDLTYTDDYTKLNSPRILKPVEGEFTLQVKVPAFPLPGDAASSGGNHSFVSTGLLVWLDEKNFIRLERAAIAGSPAPFVWFERFKDGKSVARAMKPIGDTDTGLQFVRKGNVFTLSYKDGGDDKDWGEVHSEEMDVPGKLQVGVLAINSTARDFPARLTGLELFAKK